MASDFCVPVEQLCHLYWLGCHRPSPDPRLLGFLLPQYQVTHQSWMGSLLWVLGVGFPIPRCTGRSIVYLTELAHWFFPFRDQAVSVESFFLKNLIWNFAIRDLKARNKIKKKNGNREKKNKRASNKVFKNGLKWLPISILTQYWKVLRETNK